MEPPPNIFIESMVALHYVTSTMTLLLYSIIERFKAVPFTKKHFSIALYRLTFPVLVLGAAFRIVGLTASPLWYDEAVSFYMARLTLFSMVRTQALDFSPPLNELIAWLFTRLFGFNELGMRLPALIASLVSLWLASRLTRKFGFDIQQRFAGLALAALVPYQFYLAQDGRAYSLMSMLYLAALWFALSRRWLGLAATCGLLLYSHSTGAFYAAAALALAAARWPTLWRTWLRSGLVAGATFAPWLPTLIASGQRHHWLGELTSGIFNTGLLRAFFADALPGEAFTFPAFAAIAGSLLIGAVVSIIHLRQHSRDAALLGLAAAGPLVLMVLAAVVKNVVFYRPMSAMVIPLALWFGFTIPKSNRWIKIVAGYNWAFLIIAGLIAWSPANKGAEMRTLAMQMNKPGTVIYHATGTSLLPFSILMSQAEHVLLNETQHSGLLSDDLRDAFGLKRESFEVVAEQAHGALYVAWARDALLSDWANARMIEATRGATLIGTVHYWQTAPIQVWLVKP